MPSSVPSFSLFTITWCCRCPCYLQTTNQSSERVHTLDKYTQQVEERGIKPTPTLWSSRSGPYPLCSQAALWGSRTSPPKRSLLLKQWKANLLKTLSFEKKDALLYHTSCALIFQHFFFFLRRRYTVAWKYEFGLYVESIINNLVNWYCYPDRSACGLLNHRALSSIAAGRCKAHADSAVFLRHLEAPVCSGAVSLESQAEFWNESLCPCLDHSFMAFQSSFLLWKQNCFLR